MLRLETGQLNFRHLKWMHNEKAALFRESIAVMKKVWKESFPQIQTERVEMLQGDIVPKPVLSDIPVLERAILAKQLNG